MYKYAPGILTNGPRMLARPWTGERSCTDDLLSPTLTSVGKHSARILLVEDDLSLREAVRSALSGAGYVVHAEPDGNGALGAAAAFRPDLAILEARFPTGPSGLSVALRLRDRRPLPVVFVTDAPTVEDRLAGFDAGADDYLAKPFAMAELLARVRAVLRRSGALSADRWQVGDLSVDEHTRRVHRADGVAIELTTTEFDLLAEFGRQPGRVLSKAQLLVSVWGSTTYGPNLVEVHVSALRRKLERHGPRLIHTVWGAGYRLCPPEAPPEATGAIAALAAN
jgi:two-component system, OmpR family, response regulator